jgi:CRISPR/Cas system-associated exonuclease Cas4 (RecB family)
MSYQWIRASEIGEFLYCQRAWWLRRELGVHSQNVRELEAGRHYHEAHGRLVDRARYGRQAAIALLGLVALIILWQIAGGG